MSYNVSLGRNEDGIVKVPRHSGGCVYALGGDENAWMSVTYNYAKLFLQVDGFNIRHLNRQRAGATIPILEKCVAQLGTDQDDNYWEATRGNAGHTASVLLAWARQHPDAVWRAS